ncbi:tRNA-uridine aminocarboxypropyltransferase [Paraferrimonas sp. SM1919]|uniref:tRNA-uridine aminocarboxypropyltransferase n=1 Tax=Paraferrimonas sp. SM1919 TaxID=2662263 RepID=UPI0013CFA8B4|nr:DTW domain-containing protein [Paraferrimonas sp. SM1919]
MTQLHAVQRLFLERKAKSTRPYLARGAGIDRCQACQLSKAYCQCHIRQSLNSDVAFLLIMHDAEVLKPSNSGRLIADMIPDTHAYIWNRTEPNEEMLALLENEAYQPFLIFPHDYAVDGQARVSSVTLESGKKPLFVMLDGTWREAKKMYRKSPYLQQMPMLSFQLDGPITRYTLREGVRDFQVATAEIASLAIDAAGEPQNAKALQTWFEIYCEASFSAATKPTKSYRLPLEQLQQEFLTQIKN